MFKTCPSSKLLFPLAGMWKNWEFPKLSPCSNQCESMDDLCRWPFKWEWEWKRFSKIHIHVHKFVCRCACTCTKFDTFLQITENWRKSRICITRFQVRTMNEKYHLHVWLQILTFTDLCGFSEEQNEHRDLWMKILVWRCVNSKPFGFADQNLCMDILFGCLRFEQVLFHFFNCMFCRFSQHKLVWICIAWTWIFSAFCALNLQQILFHFYNCMFCRFNLFTNSTADQPRPADKRMLGMLFSMCMSLSEKPDCDFCNKFACLETYSFPRRQSLKKILTKYMQNIFEFKSKPGCLEFRRFHTIVDTSAPFRIFSSTTWNNSMKNLKIQIFRFFFLEKKVLCFRNNSQFRFAVSSRTFLKYKTFVHEICDIQVPEVYLLFCPSLSRSQQKRRKQTNIATKKRLALTRAVYMKNNRHSRKKGDKHGKIFKNTTPQRRKNNWRKRKSRLFHTVDESFEELTPNSRKDAAKSLIKRLEPQLDTDFPMIVQSDCLNSQLLQVLLDMARAKWTKNVHQFNFKRALALKMEPAHSIQGLARRFGIPDSQNRFFYNLFSKPKSFKNMDHKRKITEEEKKILHEFIQRDDISLRLNHVRFADKIFLRMTKDEAYERFAKHLKEEGSKPMSRSSFNRSLPKNIRLLKDLPDMSCECDVCLNCSLKIEALKANKVRGLSTHLSRNVLATLCNSHSGELSEMSILDFSMKCIQRKCCFCDERRLEARIREENPDVDWEKPIVYSEWRNKKLEFVSKGKEREVSRLICDKIACSLEELLEAFLVAVKNMSMHIFNHTWQVSQFEKAKSSLQQGDVLMVCDFGTNYSHASLVAPQSTYFGRTQTTMHNAVCYFLCPHCQAPARDEIVITSEDLKHDGIAVDTYTDKMLKHLTVSGVDVQRLIRFSDNCAGQYKSLKVFEMLSRRNIPFMLNFFGSKHGKSPADGVGGRTMQQITKAVRQGNVDLPDAEAVASFLSDTLSSKACSLKNKKRGWKLSQEDKEYMKSFFRREEISCVTSNFTFLRYTFDKTYSLFRTSCRKDGRRIRSKAALFKQKPPEVIATEGFHEEGNEPSLFLVEDQDLQNNTVHTDAVDDLGADVSGQELQKCQINPSFLHVRRHFFCVNQIDRDQFDFKHVRPLDATQTIHCIRNTGKAGVLEVRQHTCTCSSCLDGKEILCENRDFVTQFKRADIHRHSFEKNRNLVENLHWKPGYSVNLNIKWQLDKKRKRCFKTQNESKSATSKKQKLVSKSADKNLLHNKPRKPRKRRLRFDKTEKSVTCASTTFSDGFSKPGAINTENTLNQLEDNQIPEHIVSEGAAQEEPDRKMDSECFSKADEMDFEISLINTSESTTREEAAVNASESTAQVEAAVNASESTARVEAAGNMKCECSSNAFDVEFETTLIEDVPTVEDATLENTVATDINNPVPMDSSSNLQHAQQQRDHSPDEDFVPEKHLTAKNTEKSSAKSSNQQEPSDMHDQKLMKDGSCNKPTAINGVSSNDINISNCNKDKQRITRKKQKDFLSDTDFVPPTSVTAPSPSDRLLRPRPSTVSFEDESTSDSGWSDGELLPLRSWRMKQHVNDGTTPRLSDGRIPGYLLWVSTGPRGPVHWFNFLSKIFEHITDLRAWNAARMHNNFGVMILAGQTSSNVWFVQNIHCLSMFTFLPCRPCICMNSLQSEYERATGKTVLPTRCLKNPDSTKAALLKQLKQCLLEKSPEERQVKLFSTHVQSSWFKECFAYLKDPWFDTIFTRVEIETEHSKMRSSSFSWTRELGSKVFQINTFHRIISKTAQ